MGRSVVIPEERVRLETRLISALDGGPDAIAAALHSFHWKDHPELACLGLAEIARRQTADGAAAIALMVGAHCARAGGPFCFDCPIRVSRAAA